jgi:hypothetical protein
MTAASATGSDRITSYRIGAALFVLWGLLHLVAAREVYLLAGAQPAGLVQGRLIQNAWHLAVFAVFGIVVAVRFNWYNSRLGFWLNLAVLGATDLGFLAFVVVPGYVPLSVGLVGPVIYLAAVAFAAAGRRQSSGAGLGRTVSSESAEG